MLTTLEETLFNSAIGSAPVALALVYSMNRIEQKIDTLIQTWRNWPPPKQVNA